MAAAGARARVLILGAAGRDFHDFNVLFRDNPDVEVVAFTATQIPGISGRRYPPALAGHLYPLGIPIEDENELELLCRREHIDRVVFAYSDVAHATVMHLASRALAGGASFELPSRIRTMLRSSLTVIAVSAVRTGCGKSQTALWLSRRLREHDLRVAVLRHPMPYGDLERQRVQRFAKRADLDIAGCTVEEREEYEPHLAAGNVVFAGVDYRAILEAAEHEANIILWDGGNNDFPFIRPDLHIVIADALRPGQAAMYFPGEAVLRTADVVVVNKVNAASPENVEQVVQEVKAANGKATVVLAASPVTLDDPDAVRGRRVLVIEDGPTITHGGMAHGAGYAAVAACDGAEIVDPWTHAAPALTVVFEQYPHIGRVIPAMGYSGAQLAALGESINRADADVVVSATPVDLASLVRIEKPVVRARYEYADAGEPTLGEVLDRFLARRGK